MAGMLASGYLERSRGLKTPLRDLSAKADPMLSSIKGSASQMISRITLKNAVLIANRGFVFVVRLFIKGFREAHDLLNRIVEKASKKTEDLSRSGAASFYLKKIKEGKGEKQITEGL